MAKYLTLPDGSSFEMKEGQTPTEAMQVALQLYPDAFGFGADKPKQDTTGLKAAASAGLERLKGQTALTAAKLGFKDVAEAEAYQKQQEAKAAARFTPTEQGWTEAPFLKFRETLGGSLPYMAAPAAAGLAALAAPVSAPVAAGLGLVGAGAVSTGQFTGSNIARQMEEGKTLEQASLGKAVGAAVPQALLDTAAMALLPGVGKLFGSVGSKLTTEQAKAIASQTLGKTIADYTAKTGLAMGREGVTEATQQVLERLQAGLSITDPEARKEYIESFIGGAVLGGTLAPVGRAFERGSAKRQAREATRLEGEAAAKVEAQRAEEEKQRLAEERTKPEYLTNLQTRYDALVKQEKELEEKTKIKPEGTDPAAKQFAAEQKKLAVQELKDFRASPEYEALVQERVEATPLMRKMEAERKATEAAFGKEPTYAAEDMSDLGQATQIKKQIDDLQKKQAGLSPAEQQPLQNRINALEGELEKLVLDAATYNAAQKQLQNSIEQAQQKLVDAATTEQEQSILANMERMETALKNLQQFKPFVKTTTQMPSVSNLRDQMDAAKATGDVEAIRKLVPQLAEAEKQGELPFATGVPSDNELAQEIANAREEAKRRSETVAKETDALFRMGEKGLTPFEIGLRKARLDEAREVMRQASKPSQERLRLAQPYRVQPGGKLNQATRTSLLVRENEQDWASFDKEAKENAFRVADREKLRDQLKAKKKDLEAEYNEFSKYGPSKALELVRTEFEAIDKALTQVERKLKLGRDKAVREPDVDTQITQASDARVAELIDRLLPFATGQKPVTADEAKAVEARQKKEALGQASLFDVEAQKELAGMEFTPAPAKPAAQKASVAPIEQAADLMDRARELRARLAEYNAQIQKAGRPSDPEKLARLNDLKDLRSSTLDELDAVQKQYAGLTERQTPLFEAEETAPGTADLFGGLEKARADANRIQRDLDKLYAERDTIRAGMERRGQVGATPQLQALAEQFSKDTPRLRQVEADIEATEARLQEASGRRSERFDEFVQAREREREEQVDTRTRTLPGFERRVGLKPVDPAKLQDAKQRLVSLKNVEETLRKARASGDADPTRYLRQVAAMKTDDYEAFLVQSNDPITKTWPLEKLKVLSKRYPKRIDPTPRDMERAETLRKEINYFNNLVKGNKRKLAENALQDNLQQQEKVRAEIADLERRQRAYEQQEAVRTGAVPGTAEAERLIAGEGYRTASGKTRTMPKKLSSWGITKVDKKTSAPVPVAKVEMTSRMLRAYQQEVQAQAEGKAVEKETLEKQIARSTKNINNINTALKQVYPDNVATEVETEIEKLLASGLEPAQLQQVENMEQTYAALKTTTAGNTVGDVLARLNAEREKLLAAQGRFTARRGSVFDDKEQKTVSFTADQQLQDIAALIRDLQKEQSKKQDAWTTAFNALIKEKNSNAVVASQELGFADLELASAKRKLDEMLEGTRQQIEEAEKRPDSPEKAALLAELNTALERQSGLLSIAPGEVRDVTEMKMSDWARRYGFGAYNSLLDTYNRAAADLEQYQFAYKKARLEQLGLTRAYGNDLQSVIDTEVANIQKLVPQLEAKAKENAEAAERLKKANQALATAKIAEREAAAKKPQDQLAAFKYSAAERAALARIREGLGLPGTRIESDTTSSLVVKTRKALRDTLNLRKAELEKAQAPAERAKVRLEEAKEAALAVVNTGNADAIKAAENRVANARQELDNAQKENAAVVQELTQEVQKLESDYESVIQLGERVITPVGEGAENRVAERVEPLAVPGTRLGRRRVGPVARVGTQPPSQMLSGTEESREAIAKGNRPMQMGTTRLTAADMNRADANAVSLAVLKQKLDAATGERKAELQAAFDNATNGMTKEQVSAQINEGNDIIAVPEAAAVVAAREKLRAAEAEFEKTEADYKAAKTPAAKELAKDALDTAQQAYFRAQTVLDDAKANVAAGLTSNKSVREQAEKAIEDALEQAQKERTKAPSTYAQRAAEADEGDVAAEYNPDSARTESNPAVMEAIMDGRFVEAVERLAVDSSNPLVRETAEDIRRLLTRTKLVIDPELMHEGQPVPALYTPQSNTVRIRPEGINDENIIHEAVHAVTLQVLRKPDDALTPQQRNAKREITAIFKQLEKRRDLKTEYGISDVEEFVSEMQSNQEFRAAVDKQPWYKRFWHALTRLWSTQPIPKISEQTSALIKQIYTPSATLNIGKQAVPTIFRRETAPASTIVGNEPGKLATLKGNLFGLAGRVQYFDRLGAADEAIVKAEGAGKLSSAEAFNAQYFMRMGDKVTQAAGQFITDGPVRIVADKVGTTTEYRYESTPGANLVNVSTAIERAAKAGGMNPAEAETMLTVLIAGQRANAVSNGWERLQSKDPAGAKAEYNAYVNKMNANPQVKSAMEDAMREYKAYNEGLLNFAAQTGYLSKDEVRRLNKQPYVPFYRVEDGNVKLFVLGERPITIGNIKNNPDLKQFLGDEKKIQPILTSAVQNTFMLTRMAMHNKATMETTNALYKAGFVSKMGKGEGLANPSTVHYKIDGDDRFAVIDADTFGIPAELIVRGMEGITATTHDLVKMMGIPADLLRKFITRSPAYIVRQLIREPMNAFIVSGVDGVPVANALRELAKMQTGRSPAEQALMRGLVVSSNIYTGGEADMQKFLGDVAAGRSGWDKFLGKLDTMALQADAATRATIYNDSIKKGFSEAKAQFRTMESANFGRRGLSPSMQMMSTLVPFFNAQIQGLDVLYRSIKGDMPFNQPLEIQRKIVARGALLFMGSLAYAFMMQDDEDYKKAKPEERYSNFFVNIPGVKDPLKLPFPFEVGLLFMGLPQALVDVAMGNATGSEASKAIGKLLLNSAPGVVPAAPKPILEAFYGQTTFGPIESEREKRLEAGERFRPGTTEVAKMLGSVTGEVGISPLLIEHFVRGYTGGLGVALMSTLNPLLRSEAEGEKMPVGASRQPFIGGLFQPSEGRFVIERAYNRMDDVIKAQQTYKDLVNRGQQDRAVAYAKDNAALIVGAPMAGTFRQRMGELFDMERKILANPKLSGAEKEAKVQQLKDMQNRMALQFYAATAQR